MASINLIVKKRTNLTTIYLRLKIGRDHDFMTNTGYYIHYNNWNISKKQPKQTNVDLIKLKSNLDKLVLKINTELNSLTSNGLDPSKSWLEDVIDVFHGKESKTQNASVSYWIKHIYSNPVLFDNNVGKKGLSQNRIKQLKTLYSVLKRFSKKRTFKISQINQALYDEFVLWLLNSENYSHNTAKKYSDDLVSIARHARRFGIPTSKDIDYIKKIK